ncbi:MAG: hypothetical protein NUW24_02250 [Anaerolineae bacterium]|jgi:hypothetical protein|nr:hypothetical protein [Anaerolineae bacterium]MDH7473581.1 hypothetical protein [Anaerolineae bacterium]
MARQVKVTDDYLSQVLKHIPTEIVMAYVSIDGVLRTTYHTNVAHERELWRVMRVKRFEQLFISTLSVPVWLFVWVGRLLFKVGTNRHWEPWFCPCILLSAATRYAESGAIR